MPISFINNTARCIFTELYIFKENQIVMKSRLLLSAVFLISYHFILAQDNTNIAAFNFETTTHDFGTVEETGGPISFTFNFTNTGKVPLVIQNVQPSCGCTTPDWTRQPVPPGKTGFVKAEYNPMNRPGAFNKSLTITANTNPAITRLYIQGTVNHKPNTITDEYPAQIGGLRARYRSFNFGRITTEKPVTRSFDIFNDTDHTITFRSKVDAPAYIHVMETPVALPAKTKGVINVTYDRVKKNVLGFVTDQLVLYTDEAGQDSIKDFLVVATIEEYFPPMTAEELAKAPRLRFDKTAYDFGNIKSTEKMEAQFTMTNNGKSKLNIRETKANCECTKAVMDKNTLAPGESQVVKVTFDPTGRRGVQQKSVSIFSNDPTNPTQMLTIKANVAMPEGSK